MKRYKKEEGQVISAAHRHTHCLILVADGARADLFERLLGDGELPNIERHVVKRGCYRRALTVFPSTTGPAHIPFVCGLHPGTANVPGYRWLCRATHDAKRRSIFRHRSLNSPRGMLLWRDMDRERADSLYRYFDKPSSVLELIDYCPDKHLYKLRVRRLYRVVRAHMTDDWGPVDRMVERLIINRLRAGSECVIGSFFGIDEYSHLYDPFDDRTIAAYKNIDAAVGRIMQALEQEHLYERVIVAIVSDHGLSATHTHIPLVDIVTTHGFAPYHYPKLFRRRHDSAVMESGNAMAQLYFKRGDHWGGHRHSEEMLADRRIGPLIETLKSHPGISFLMMRNGAGGIVFLGRSGMLCAERANGRYRVTVTGDNPLREHPEGMFSGDELRDLTYDHTFPDAVNQLFWLFASPRSGDVLVSAEPGFDLRLQYEDPEHHGSHGSLHREHMHVPLAMSVPFAETRVRTFDIVPTILALAGRTPERTLDGRVLTVGAL